MYLSNILQLKSQAIITKDEYDILKTLFDSIVENKVDKASLKLLDNVIKNEYDRLFKLYNTDVQIYEVTDVKYYPKSMTEREMLIVENIECLIQTKQLSFDSQVVIKRIIN